MRPLTSEAQSASPKVVSANDLRECVQWLARHAKGMNFEGWCDVSNTILAAANVIERRYHCNICGGDVDLANATKPTAKVGVGRPLKQSEGRS